MKLSEEKLNNLLHQHLQPGELLSSCAYGVKQPPILLIILLFLAGVLPGAIAVALLTKHYIVGLTDRRLIVLRTNSGFAIQEVWSYDLAQKPSAQGSVGPIFTHLKIDDPQKPFQAKFHRAAYGLPNNRNHSIAIAEAMTGQTLRS